MTSHHAYPPSYDHYHDHMHCHVELTAGQWTHTIERRNPMKTTINFGCLTILLFATLVGVGIVAGIIALFT